MNQKIMIVDDFYDIAHQYHKSIVEDNQLLITQETQEKLEFLLGSPLEIEGLNDVRQESTEDPIIANFSLDWIAVIYLTMPPQCVSKRGLSFYKHKSTDLDIFPTDYNCKVFGWNSIDDVNKSFDSLDKEQWEEYSKVFVKYNRCVLFRANLWHSYGEGFGNNLNNSMINQRLLIRNGKR